MKDLENVNRTFGCEVLYNDSAGIYSINQTKYVKDQTKYVEDMCYKFLPKGSVGV